MEFEVNRSRCGLIASHTRAFATKCFDGTNGNAKPAVQCPTSKCIINNFAANREKILQAT
jgi:hypothetical protein